LRGVVDGRYFSGGEGAVVDADVVDEAKKHLIRSTNFRHCRNIIRYFIGSKISTPRLPGTAETHSAVRTARVPTQLQREGASIPTIVPKAATDEDAAVL